MGLVMFFIMSKNEETKMSQTKQLLSVALERLYLCTLH